MQLKDVADDAMPRAYLAWPLEIAARLKAASGDRGDTILWENYTLGADTAGARTEHLLDEWKMTRERVEELMNGDAAANP